MANCVTISIRNFKEVKPGLPEVDKDEQDALDQIKSRRPRIKLEALGINPGDTLTFSRDENITAVVSEGGKIIDQDEVLSASAAALKVLHSLGYQTPAASGSEYWMLDGELLDERRRRMQAQQFEQGSESDD